MTLIDRYFVKNPKWYKVIQSSSETLLEATSEAWVPDAVSSQCQVFNCRVNDSDTVFIKDAQLMDEAFSNLKQSKPSPSLQLRVVTLNEPLFQEASQDPSFDKNFVGLPPEHSLLLE